jgi:hypothetical protein
MFDAQGDYHAQRTLFPAEMASRNINFCAYAARTANSTASIVIPIGLLITKNTSGCQLESDHRLAKNF